MRASTGVQSAVDAMQGKTVPRDQSADSLFVTPATVNSAKAQQYIYDVNCKRLMPRYPTGFSL